MFQIVLHKNAAKKLAKISVNDRERIAKALSGLEVNPYLGKRLKGEYQGSCRIRLGDYRIIYGIDETQKTVIIHAIGSRGDVYK